MKPIAQKALKPILSGVAVAWALTTSLAVRADNFWSFDFQNAHVSVVGLIDTSSSLNSLGNYDVLAISGTITGMFPITATNAPIGPLLANPNQPNVYMAPNGNIWDNNLSAAAPFVTANGVAFSFAGDQLVLFSGPEGPGTEGLFSQNRAETAIGTLTVTEVPEPSTWLLIITAMVALAVSVGGAHHGRAARRSLPAPA
jgi:hypothetical protein